MQPRPIHAATTYPCSQAQSVEYFQSHTVTRHVGCRLLAAARGRSGASQRSFRSVGMRTRAYALPWHWVRHIVTCLHACMCVCLFCWHMYAYAFASGTTVWHGISSRTRTRTNVHTPKQHKCTPRQPRRCTQKETKVSTWSICRTPQGRAHACAHACRG